MSQLPDRRGLPPLLSRPLLFSKGKKKSLSYEPIHWSNYFDKSDVVQLSQGTFQYYMSYGSGPLLWFIHGAGFSSLTWAKLAKTLRDQTSCQLFAVDLRGHGDTWVKDEADMSMENLRDDMISVLHSVIGRENPPPVVLIGHSLGGALAVYIAKVICSLYPYYSVRGVVVLDVVESTVLESLRCMRSVVLNRPTTFQNLSQAVQWSVSSGMIRDSESARVSFPGQLVRCNSRKLTGTQDVTCKDFNTQLSTTCSASANSLPEPNANCQRFNDSSHVSSDSTNSCAITDVTLHSPHPQYTWRVDLLKTKPHWDGWFRGLTKELLSLKVPVLLCLAGLDQLDKDLIVGQMQGKFQCNFIQNSGHCIQEDASSSLSSILVAFMVRQKLIEKQDTHSEVFPCC